MMGYGDGNNPAINEMCEFFFACHQMTLSANNAPLPSSRNKFGGLRGARSSRYLTCMSNVDNQNFVLSRSCVQIFTLK